MNQDYKPSAGTHPITPPPELVQEWWDDTHGAFYEFEAITIQAAQWGADQELEACCSEMDGWGDIQYSAGYEFSKKLRWRRRPKPPSLKERALESLEGLTLPEDAFETIRCAIEQLPD